MRPLTPVAQGTRVVLGVSFFVLFVALWSAVTFGGLVPKIFLVDPLQMLGSGWTLLTERATRDATSSRPPTRWA